MADDAGFLEQLGIPSVDERSLLAAQRREQRQRPGYNADFSRGEQARPLLIGAFNALGGLLNKQGPESGKSGRSFGGAVGNFFEGVTTETDRQTAEAAGITPEALSARRAIREELKRQPAAVQDEQGFTSQINMARKVASLALKHGDADTYGRAISQLSKLQVQQNEFSKLQAETTVREEQAAQEGLVDGFYNGKAVTGTMAFQVDPATGERVAGLVLNDGGDNYFQPFGKELSRDDPSARVPGESLDQRIRRSTAREFVAKLKDQVATGATSLQKFDRTMEQVSRLRDTGRTAALGGSGTVLTWINSAVENFKGVAQAFSNTGYSVDNSKTYRSSQDSEGNVRSSGVRAWMAENIANEDAEIWDVLQLPAGVTAGSREAQNYRANLMELAYMAARMAEPSNRGLSDNDIRNALIRLGDSTEPDVILTRFAEIVGDAAFDIENRMGTLYGNFGDGPEATDEKVAKAVGGDTYFKYRQGLKDLQKKYGFSYTSTGAIDWGSTDPAAAPGEETDDEFLQRLINQGGAQ